MISEFSLVTIKAGVYKDINETLFYLNSHGQILPH